MAKEPKTPAPGTDPANPITVAVVPAPAPTDGFSAGDALTPGQKAGLDPLDEQWDDEQSKDRANLTNMQTDHEMANGLDSVSRGPSPGISVDTPLTAKQIGAPPTDMSGRPALTLADEEVFGKLRQKLTESKRDDKAKGGIREDQIGWRTPFEMGIPGGVVARIVGATDPDGEKVEKAVVPNGQFFPETGTRYRLK